MGTLGYLLDTHTFLWAVCEGQKLSDKAQKVIEDTGKRVFVSSISAYEITNKYRIGKLPGYAYVAENYIDIIGKFGAEELSINTRHTHFAGAFEWAHRDPFDRLLAAQAFIEELTLVTNDAAFRTLPWINILW